MNKVLKTYYCLIALLLSTSCGGSVEKFNWLVTESSPAHYPMEIVEGHFVFDDGSSIYVPSQKTLHKGWGQMVSTHVVGDEFKPIPVQLDIVFFSYLEDTFYQGSFQLPQRDMARLFQKGFFSLQKDKQDTFSRIMVGVAPGGGVAVWLFSSDVVKEVFYGKAEVTDVPWSRINNDPEYARKDFIADELEDVLSSEVLSQVLSKDVPLNTWDNYRKPYPWYISFSAIRSPKYIHAIKYLNGEKEYLPFTELSAMLDRPRALPKSIRFFWKNLESKAYTIELTFDEHELKTIVSLLSNHNDFDPSEGIEFAIVLDSSAPKPLITLTLQNKELRHVLSKTKAEVFRATLNKEDVERLI